MSRRVQIELDLRLKRIAAVAHTLPARTARHGRGERARLVKALIEDKPLKPAFSSEPARVEREIWHALDEARVLAPEVSAGDLYLSRLDELELELTLLEVLGDPTRVRPMAARRFGTGDDLVRMGRSDVPLRDVAAVLLDEVSGPAEARTLPATAEEGPSLEAVLRRVAAVAGLEIDVRVEPELVADAAAGERTVFISNRRFGEREAARLAVHEVLGHLVAAANGRSQPIGLTTVGTAGSFTDQEGLALALEERSGLLDAARVRTFAARVWVTDRMHAGARFGDVARDLVRQFAFSARDAIALGERAYRGGGVARDAAYLRGWLRVRRALNAGEATIDELRIGRVGLDDLETLRELIAMGELRPPVYCPDLSRSLSRSLGATAVGTNASTFPPSFAASLTKFDET